MPAATKTACSGCSTFTETAVAAMEEQVLAEAAVAEQVLVPERISG
jgi:Fe-S cluster biogenesis protein NfuA